MNPLTLRQTLQTADIQALREAMGQHGLQAREAAQKRVLDERTTLEQNNVAQIPQSEAMRAEERKGRERQGRQEQSGDQGQDEEAETGVQGTGPAISAEHHLDFLI